MKNIEPLEFTAAPPAKRPFMDLFKGGGIAHGLKKLGYFIVLIFSAYDAKPVEPKDFSIMNPEGKIDEKQLGLCQGIYDEAKGRDATLNQKATLLLSSISILVPLIVSALVYIKTIATHNMFLSIAVIPFSLLFLSAAFMAAIKALYIRYYDVPSLRAVVDVAQKKVKAYSTDEHGRLLLWCATMHTAMNDHKTDMIRAGQLFITLSMLMLILGAVPLIYSLSPEMRYKRISGEVQVSSVAMENLMADIKNEIRLSRDDYEDKAKMRREIEALSQRLLKVDKEVSEIRKRALE